jgi:hypothetical protein
MSPEDNVLQTAEPASIGDRGSKNATRRDDITYSRYEFDYGGTASHARIGRYQAIESIVHEYQVKRFGDERQLATIIRNAC